MRILDIVRKRAGSGERKRKSQHHQHPVLRLLNAPELEVGKTLST
jgi:hypothetical protein